MSSNQIIITDCSQCANWTPADSSGCGCHCDELNRVVHAPDVGEDMPIPDECPLLANSETAVAKFCRWDLDDIDGKWDTGCGEAHVFEIDGPVENNYKYCPYCGKRLAVQKNNH